MKKLVTICILLVLMSTGAANAAFTLTFDELPKQSVDGLSYNGITFGFEVGGNPSTQTESRSRSARESPRRGPSSR